MLRWQNYISRAYSSAWLETKLNHAEDKMLAISSEAIRNCYSCKKGKSKKTARLFSRAYSSAWLVREINLNQSEVAKLYIKSL
jgi:hypothetical protein